MNLKVKKDELVRCKKSIDSYTKIGTLYKIDFFLHKDTHICVREIDWMNRMQYWVYLVDERNKTWKYDFMDYEINIKLIRKMKITKILSK